MTSARRFFGTDGIRGRVGAWPITPDFIMKLGWAAGRVLVRGGKGKVLIGKDTRISGYMFESALEAGLSAAGVDILLLGPMPTPGIAYLTHSLRADAGIVISASHNPFEDNGIKFFTGHGTKLADDVELAIEAELEQPLTTVAPAQLGKARRIDDAQRRYIEFCKSRLDPELDLGGLRLVVDCAHGAAYQIAPRVFEELGAAVDSIAVQPDGLNINAGCGATAPEALRRRVLDTGADAGLALDGDGDRLIVVDAGGAIVDGDDILYIIAGADPAALNGAVVGTQMTNLGLEHALRALGLALHRARVGDRYVMEMLQEKQLRLGGEGSGHVINLNLALTGDGIVTALQVLAAMRRSGQPLRALLAGMHKYPQRLVNVALPGRMDTALQERIDALGRGAAQRLGGRGRVLLRPSGTEPLLRVMVEGEDGAEVDRLAQELATRVRALTGGAKDG
jgi:phosphoglucosamine mutase